MKRVELFTDGSCPENPGRGGWAYVLRHGSVEVEASGGEPDTTNNRMEITAAIRGLEALREPCEVVVTTDSKYLSRGASSWLQSWKRSGWKGDTVKNRDLWERLDELQSVHRVRWVWVRGHAGHPENERCDRLASHAAGGEIKSELPDAPTRMDELPHDLRGPSQNKYGGQRNVKLRTYGGKFGAASPGRTLSPDEVEEWRRKNLSGQ